MPFMSVLDFKLCIGLKIFAKGVNFISKIIYNMVGAGLSPGKSTRKNNN